MTLLIGQQVVFFALGAVVGVMGGYWTASLFLPTPAALATGVGLALALVAAFRLLPHLAPRSAAAFDATLIALWQRLALNWSPFTVVVLAVTAGVGEEALFRTLQLWAGSYLPAWLVIPAVALLFGAAHAASRLYFVAATLFGLLFAVVFHLGGSLLALMLAHAGYDLWAIERLRRLLTESRAAGAV